MGERKPGLHDSVGTAKRIVIKESYALRSFFLSFVGIRANTSKGALRVCCYPGSVEGAPPPRWGGRGHGICHTWLAAVQSSFPSDCMSAQLSWPRRHPALIASRPPCALFYLRKPVFEASRKLKTCSCFVMAWRLRYSTEAVCSLRLQVEAMVGCKGCFWCSIIG